MNECDMARLEGQILGGRFNRDPWKACRELRIAVVPIAHARLQDLSPIVRQGLSGQVCLGRRRWSNGGHIIELSDILHREGATEVLAHELAHVRGFKDEDASSAFADAFLKAGA